MHKNKGKNFKMFALPIQITLSNIRLDFLTHVDNLVIGLEHIWMLFIRSFIRWYVKLTRIDYRFTVQLLFFIFPPFEAEPIVLFFLVRPFLLHRSKYCLCEEFIWHLVARYGTSNIPNARWTLSFPFPHTWTIHSRAVCVYSLCLLTGWLVCVSSMFWMRIFCARIFLSRWSVNFCWK